MPREYGAKHVKKCLQVKVGWSVTAWQQWELGTKIKSQKSWIMYKANNTARYGCQWPNVRLRDILLHRRQWRLAWLRDPARYALHWTHPLSVMHSSHAHLDLIHTFDSILSLLFFIPSTWSSTCVCSLRFDFLLLLPSLPAVPVPSPFPLPLQQEVHDKPVQLRSGGRGHQRRPLFHHKMWYDSLGKTLMEISVINWWRNSHQSSTRESLRLLWFCVVSWKDPSTSKCQRILEGKDRMDHIFSKLHRIWWNQWRADWIRAEHFRRIHHVAALW